MNLQGKVEFAGVTHVGRKRSHNEDSIGSDVKLGLAVIADGMGGYRAGEVASSLAVNMLMDVVRDEVPKLKPGQIDAETGYSNETLLIHQAIDKANEEIFRTAESQPECQGMGTTLVAVMFYDDRMTVANVGDSRLYRLREDQFEQMTADHSLLQELVDKGFYTRDEARQSLNKNLVTRAMGIELTVTPDLQEGLVLPGDLYLLCSDGLSDLVRDEDMHSTLNTYNANLRKAAERLVEMANDKGGNDNISVILARARKPFPAKRSWYARLFDWF